MKHNTQLVMDVFNEILNVGVGRAAETMNTMLDKHVTLTAPVIDLMSFEDLRKKYILNPDSEYSAIGMNYTGLFNGLVELVFDVSSASRLVDCLMVSDSLQHMDLDSIRAGTLCEIGNIVINAVLGTMANMLDIDLSFSVPLYHEEHGATLFGKTPDDMGSMVLLSKTSFFVKQMEITGDIVMFFSFTSLDLLIDFLVKHYDL